MLYSQSLVNLEFCLTEVSSVIRLHLGSLLSLVEIMVDLVQELYVSVSVVNNIILYIILYVSVSVVNNITNGFLYIAACDG